MKRKILLLLVVISSSATISFGQISPGKILLGGSIGYNKSKNTQSPQPNLSSDYSSLSSNIQLGKFTRENTAAGFFLSYSYYSSTQNNQLAKNSYYSAGIFYRKYKTLARNFYALAEGDLSYIYSKNKQVTYQNPDLITKGISNGGSLSFTPGLSYGVLKKLQLELLLPNIFSISYLHTKTNYNYTTASSEGNTFAGDVNLNSSVLSNLAVGFKLFL